MNPEPTSSPTTRRAARAAAVAGLLAVLLPAAPALGASRADEAVVRFRAGIAPAAQRAAVRHAGGRVTRDLHLIHGLGVRGPARALARLRRDPAVARMAANAAMRSSAAHAGRWADWRPDLLATAFVQSTRADKAWTDPRGAATGEGITVAVVDTGIAGDLPDFAAGPDDPSSRVIATAVVNPDATTAEDRYGHGTHVAGLVAGDSRGRGADDPLAQSYAGTAPEADLVAIKASDDHGASSVIDAIDGVQFAVDHAAEYGIRVINLSLSSSEALPYREDPLDAAVEAAWLHGLVVVTAAGNRGTAPDAVSYAPANDPYVITVGGVDDHGTKDTLDDTLAPWSSRGVTQDGLAKPDLVAPGAHIVAPLAPGSDFAALCPACVVDGGYFRIGGTSMAAPLVAGIVADVLSVHPDWTPDQVKGALTYRSADGVEADVRSTADGAWEVAADAALGAAPEALHANEGLVPNDLVDPASGDIDWTRASWSRASWSSAADALRASWSRASWSCACGGADAAADPTRASWSRASWSRASWSSFLGETPGEYGELAGGDSGAVPAKAPAGSPEPAAAPARPVVSAPAAVPAPAMSPAPAVSPAPATGAVKDLSATSPRPTAATRAAARRAAARRAAAKRAAAKRAAAKRAAARRRALARGR